jgi:hypothetical protein
VAEAYKVRWQIELIFKAWKSSLRLQKMLHSECANIHRVETSIYLMLVFFCLIVQQVYLRYNEQLYELKGAYLSLLKVCKFIGVRFMECLGLSPQKLKELLCKYCCYENRNDRTNMTETIRKKQH